MSWFSKPTYSVKETKPDGGEKTVSGGHSKGKADKIAGVFQQHGRDARVEPEKREK